MDIAELRSHVIEKYANNKFFVAGVWEHLVFTFVIYVSY
jgi:hypothetical protein